MDAIPPEINLEEISKIPENQFKQYFRNWLQKDEVIAKHIQAKLRKDLIENFNKTTLGRKMFSQHVKSQRLTISPVLLALNTLIAEFLYAQNCHFALSVFCTEVPFQNTFPDFENIQNFRFNKNEIADIFEAINLKIFDETKNQILTEYLDSENQNVNSSLLFIIFKYIFKNNMKSSVQQTSNSPDYQTQQSSMFFQSPKFKKYKTKNIATSYNNYNFRYLNKYLITLTRKIKEMSYSLDKLHQTEAYQKHNNNKNTDTKTHTNESLKRNLEKISDNLRILSITKGANKKTSTIVAAVEKMSKQFVKCASNFEKLINIDKSKSAYKSYSDWIHDLQNSKCGRKLLTRIEHSLRGTLEKEKDRLTKNFQEEILYEKERLRLKYKHKLLKQMHKIEYNAETGTNLNHDIEEKLKKYELRQEEFIKKTLEETENKRKIINDIDKNKEKSSDSDKHFMTNTKTPEATKKELLEKITPQLQLMAKSRTGQERNVDHIVFDAKLRMQGLEYESTQLDLAFQDYLNRQKLEKNETKENISAIWDNYSREKENLRKNYALLKKKSESKINNNFNEYFENILLEMPKLKIERETQKSYLNQDMPSFQNPFRNFHKHRLPSKEQRTQTSHQRNDSNVLGETYILTNNNNGYNQHSYPSGSNISQKPNTEKTLNAKVNDKVVLKDIVSPLKSLSNNNGHGHSIYNNAEKVKALQNTSTNKIDKSEIKKLIVETNQNTKKQNQINTASGVENLLHDERANETKVDQTLRYNNHDISTDQKDTEVSLIISKNQSSNS